MEDFEQFYKAHLRLVYAAALARRADPEFAGDVVQETFFRAWRHRATLEDMEPLARRVWLVRTAASVIVDDWRSRERRELREAAWQDLRPPAMPDLASTANLRMDAVAAISELEETDRRIVLMRHYLQMSGAEIAEVLEMPEGTVRYRLMMAHRTLASKLAAWNPARREERAS